MAEAFDSDLYSYLRYWAEDEREAKNKPEMKKCGGCGEEHYVSEMNFEKDVQNYVCIPCLKNPDYEESKQYIKPIKL